MRKLNFLLFLNVLDWFFSLVLFREGAIELNPFLSGDPVWFSIKKFALMAFIYYVGKYLLLKNDGLVGWVLAAANGIFLGVVFFEVYWLFQLS